MRILEFKVNYEPEIASGIDLDSNTAEDLASAGHEIFLYVPTPTRGISHQMSKSTPKKEDKINGRLHIYRYSMYKEGKSTVLRVVRYCLCLFKQLWHGLRLKNVDVIFAGSTPPFQGLAVGIIKKIKKVPFVYNCQDIFPDSMVTAGITNEGSLIWKIGNWIANKTYAIADSIIVISESMRDNLLAKGVPDYKIHIVYNWIDNSVIHPVEKKDNGLLKELGIPEFYFTVVYAGNLGYAQGVEIIADTAKLLKANSRIGFVVFGDGACRSDLEKIISDEELSNIFLLPLQPYERVSEVYSIGDVNLILCKPGTGGNAMPSKTWTIMGCARPIIASFDKDTPLEKIINEIQCGFFCKSGDAKRLAELLDYVSTLDKAILRMMGTNGLRFVTENNYRKICTSKINSIICKQMVVKDEYEDTCVY